MKIVFCLQLRLLCPFLSQTFHPTLHKNLLFDWSEVRGSKKNFEQQRDRALSVGCLSTMLSTLDSSTSGDRVRDF